jgi:hypothetical protein
MYYSSSGRVPGWGWALATPLALLATIFYSLLYAYFLAFMPVVYLNVAGPVALGYLLGAVVLLLAWLGHFRSERKLHWLAGGMGGLAWYLNWVGYAAFAIAGHGFLGHPELLANLFIRPHVVAEVMGEIYKVGMWSLGTSGVPIFGWPLAIIWTLEAVIIIGLPVLFLRSLRLHPYGEVQGRWYGHRRLLPMFENIAAKQMFTSELETERLEAVFRLGYGMGHRHSRVYLHECADEEVQYLSVHNIYVASGRDQRTKVIEYFALSQAELGQLATKYGTQPVGWIERMAMQVTGGADIGGLFANFAR